MLERASGIVSAALIAIAVLALGAFEARRATSEALFRRGGGPLVVHAREDIARLPRSAALGAIEPSGAATMVKWRVCIRGARDAAALARQVVLVMVSRRSGSARVVSRLPLAELPRLFHMQGEDCSPLPDRWLVPGPNEIYVVSDTPATAGALASGARLRVEGLPTIPVSPFERALVVVAALGALFQLVRWRARPKSSAPQVPWLWSDLVLGVGLFVVVGAATDRLSAAITHPGLNVLLAFVVRVVGTIAIAWWLASRRASGVEDALALVRPAQLGVAFSFVFGLVLGIGGWVLLRLAPPPDAITPALQLSRASGTTVAIAVFGMLTPLTEEIFYRGYLYGVLERWVPRLAAPLTALAFVLAHLTVHQGWLWPLVPIALLGACASWFRWRSGSTTASCALHLGYNIVAIGPLALSM